MAVLIELLKQEFSTDWYPLTVLFVVSVAVYYGWYLFVLIWWRFKAFRVKWNGAWAEEQSRRAEQEDTMTKLTANMCRCNGPYCLECRAWNGPDRTKELLDGMPEGYTEPGLGKSAPAASLAIEPIHGPQPIPHAEKVTPIDSAYAYLQPMAVRNAQVRRDLINRGKLLHGKNITLDQDARSAAEVEPRARA